MLNNRSDFEDTSITYIPFVETKRNQGKGILKKLSELSSMVVIDDFPTYFPRIVANNVAAKLPVLSVAIDSNGILPMSLAGKECLTAHSFRRFMHKNVLNFIESEIYGEKLPIMTDLKKLSQKELKVIADEVEWEFTPLEWLWRAAQIDDIGISALSSIDINHSVFPVTSAIGGSSNAFIRMSEFVDEKLSKYSENRNKPVKKPLVVYLLGYILVISHLMK